MLDESLAANEILSYQPFDCDVQIDTVINIEGKEKQLEQCTKERWAPQKLYLSRITMETDQSQLTNAT